MHLRWRRILIGGVLQDADVIKVRTEGWVDIDINNLPVRNNFPVAGQ